MDYIKLVDNTQIIIEDGGSIGDLTNISMTEADALAVIGALTPENVTHLEFYTKGDETPYGEYDNMVIISAPTRIVDNDKVIIKFGFREETAIEKRVTALEEGQTNTEVALAEVYEMIVE